MLLAPAQLTLHSGALQKEIQSFSVRIISVRPNKPSCSNAAGVTIRPEQRQAQADRDACDRLLKAIFDRSLGQRQRARVTGIPLSTVQRALQRVIYPYRQDRPIEDRVSGDPLKFAVGRLN